MNVWKNILPFKQSRPSWRRPCCKPSAMTMQKRWVLWSYPIRYLPWSFYRPVDFVFYEKYIIFKMAHVPAMFHKKKVWLKKRCLRHAEEVNMEWIYNAFSKRWTKKHIDSDWKNHGNPGTGSHPDRKKVWFLFHLSWEWRFASFLISLNTKNHLPNAYTPITSMSIYFHDCWG